MENKRWSLNSNTKLHAQKMKENGLIYARPTKYEEDRRERGHASGSRKLPSQPGPPWASADAAPPGAPGWLLVLRWCAGACATSTRSALGAARTREKLLHLVRGAAIFLHIFFKFLAKSRVQPGALRPSGNTVEVPCSWLTEKFLQLDLALLLGTRLDSGIL